MYLIQRTKDKTFFSMMVYPSPQAAAGMWTTSKGFASWYPSKDAAKQLIDIKARSGEWDASGLQIVPVRETETASA